MSEVNAIQLEATAEDGVAHTLPSSNDAIAHFKTTLLCSSAGAFVGDYTGSENGNIAFMVDPVSGEVDGVSYHSASEVSYGVNSLTEVDYENDFGFVTGEDSAKKFTGKLSSSDEMQGSWLNVSDNTKTGSFSGERLGGNAGAVYRYTAVFTGDNGKGIYTFDVANNNGVSGIAYHVSSQAESSLTGTITGNTLDVTAADGTKIDGLIDETTRALTGVWANVSVLDAGTFSGGGCKLN